MLTRLAVLTMALLAAACAKTDEDVQGLPPPVVKAIDAFAEECAAAGGVANTRDAARRVDLNGDKRADFVVYAGWIPCDNAPGVFGDRTKVLMVFAGDTGDDAQQAFSDDVYDATVETRDSRQELWLTTSGEECGRTQAAAFADETFCDRQLVWTTAGRFELAPLDAARLLK
ncbi:MAG: hypothetical protein H7A12_08885 [Pseudomonadales bacterium]|jgi:hypothetical protein|nr:hypothetical protein [Pseudomonadales bacterium]MCP5320922.1 hypothetical protein [Pseudomonadales bacterium]MCP5338293.1 hypothetical protein [Pseudomonadales bacterium]